MTLILDILQLMFTYTNSNMSYCITMRRAAKYDVALNDLFIGECGHVLTSHVLRLPVVGYWGFHSADMVCTT